MLSAGQYGPRDRVLLCRGDSGCAQVIHTRCLTDAWKLLLLGLVACLPAGCLNEGARGSSPRQAMTPAKYDEEPFATNHNAATGGGGYHDTINSPSSRAAYADIYKNQAGT